MGRLWGATYKEAMGKPGGAMGRLWVGYGENFVESVGSKHMLA